METVSFVNCTSTLFQHIVYTAINRLVDTCVPVGLAFQGFVAAHQKFVDENSLVVEQRENEILQIVRSIQDLNDIFKELASIVVDQVSFYLEK